MSGESSNLNTTGNQPAPPQTGGEQGTNQGAVPVDSIGMGAATGAIAVFAAIANNIEAKAQQAIDDINNERDIALNGNEKLKIKGILWYKAISLEDTKSVGESAVSTIGTLKTSYIGEIDKAKNDAIASIGRAVQKPSYSGDDPSNQRPKGECE